MNCVFCQSYTDCVIRVMINNPCPDGYENVEYFGINRDLAVICDKYPK